MISIDKSHTVVPQILSSGYAGDKERISAINYYSKPKIPKPFNFTVYRNENVKKALAKLFNGKCAYCESQVLHIYPGDVEHFRPKGEVSEANPTKPGYYWLASDWDNLLLSCRNCNQKLKHEIYSITGKVTMGKMNQFPLLNNDERKRVRVHNNANGILSEEPFRLLLNPYIDNPEEHLEFDENTGIIKSKKINGIPSIKGETSIKVYVLQRVPLVLARQRVLIEIQAQIQRVNEAIINVNKHLSSDSGTKFYFDQILKRELKKLKDYTKPTQEYSAMAKQVVSKYLLTNFSILV